MQFDFEVFSHITGPQKAQVCVMVHGPSDIAGRRVGTLTDPLDIDRDPCQAGNCSAIEPTVELHQRTVKVCAPLGMSAENAFG